MSYRPLTLYSPDSDDSSSDGGSLGNHVAMGIANDRCGRDNDSDRFSIDSNLLEDIDGEEFDDPAVELKNAQFYNPLNFRVTAGKRVGIDSDDESEGDGEHYGEDRDFSPAKKIARMGDIDEHSVGSDDEFRTAHSTNFPKRITRNDAEFDSMVPTGNAKERTTGGPGEPDNALSTDEQIAAKKQEMADEEEKGKKSLEKAKKLLSPTREKSKQIVAESLAKARAIKGTDTGSKAAKQFYLGKAKQVAEKEGMKFEPSSEATREKGQKSLVKMSKNIKFYDQVYQGKVAKEMEPDLKNKITEAGSKKAKAGALKQIKLSGADETSSKLQKVLNSVARKEKKMEPSRVKAIRKEVEESVLDKRTNAASVLRRAIKRKLLASRSESEYIKLLIEQKMAKERAEAGVTAGKKKPEEDESTVVGEGKTVITERKGEKETELSTAKVGEKNELTAGRVIEIRSTSGGKYQRLFYDGTPVSSGSTVDHKNFLEGILREIKVKYGDTGLPDIRFLLGKRIYETQANINRKAKTSTKK